MTEANTTQSSASTASSGKAPSGMKRGEVTANGIRFVYFEMGQGPLVLLIHGFPDTPHGWSELMPVLAKAGYRAVAPFTRGYAPTQMPPTSSTTTEDLAKDALALIPALGHEDAVVIGHDWGAATAYLATAMEPGRITKLVTVAIPHPASLKPSLGMVWGARHFIAFRLPGAVSRAQRNNIQMVDDLYRRWSPTWKFGPEETAHVKEAFSNRESLDAAIGYYRGFKPGYVDPALKRKMTVPTLAVAGLDDPILAVEAYERAASRFAAPYKVVAIPGGHFPHRESPAQFNEAVLQFLKS